MLQLLTCDCKNQIFSEMVIVSGCDGSRLCPSASLSLYPRIAMKVIFLCSNYWSHMHNRHHFHHLVPEQTFLACRSRPAGQTNQRLCKVCFSVTAENKTRTTSGFSPSSGNLKTPSFLTVIFAVGKPQTCLWWLVELSAWEGLWVYFIVNTVIYIMHACKFNTACIKFWQLISQFLQKYRQCLSKIFCTLNLSTFWCVVTKNYFIRL